MSEPEPASTAANTANTAASAGPVAGSVTVIVVNWNGGALLAQCIEALRAQTLQPHAVLLVDNASTDHSLDALPAWDRLRTLRMDSNLGFAAANNRAIAQCDTEYIALLNPDALAEPDWLQQLLAAAQAHPQAAAFGSRQLDFANPALLDGTGDSYHISGMAWRTHHGQAQDASHLQARDIFSPCAAAALYRCAAVKAVGAFDESFFCYLEDVDLGFRLRLAGHTARYVPGAVVRHVGSASTGGQRSAFASYHGHRNLAWVYAKNMPEFLFWTLLPLHLLAQLASTLVLAARGQARVALRAKADAVHGLPRAWRQRRTIQQRRTASHRDIWRALTKRPPHRKP